MPPVASCDVMPLGHALASVFVRSFVTSAVSYAPAVCQALCGSHFGSIPSCFAENWGTAAPLPRWGRGEGREEEAEFGGTERRKV